MKQTLVPIALLFALAVVITGCDSSRNSGTPPGPQAVQTDEGDQCDGEWCAPHGLAEAECSMCSKKKADEFKKNGDWCHEHKRADSQCFICHPELEAQAAAKYKELYGKEMPKPKKNTATP